jgi:glycosyltransferase involved in cell wall biosynthesis
VVHDRKNGEFAYIGRLVDYKGTDLAIEALTQCPEEVRLTVFGEGPELSRLKRLVRTLGLSDRVTFAGWLRNEEFSREMSRFRGFVFPTMREANGIVMQEAMMLGLPVITLRWGGPTALADDGSACFVDPVGHDETVRGLADHMTRLAEDPELADRISRNARRIAEERYRWETVAASWAAHYLPQSAVAE